jgi:hypothetical protein
MIAASPVAGVYEVVDRIGVKAQRARRRQLGRSGISFGGTTARPAEQPRQRLALMDTMKDSLGELIHGSGARTASSNRWRKRGANDQLDSRPGNHPRRAGIAIQQEEEK